MEYDPARTWIVGWKGPRQGGEARPLQGLGLVDDGRPYARARILSVGPPEVSPRFP